MPGQPRRNAPGDRHYIDVQVSVVLSSEGDQRSVRRKRGVRFQTFVGRQAANILAVEIRYPQITGIDKCNVILADRWLCKQPSVVDVNALGCGGKLQA